MMNGSRRVLIVLFGVALMMSACSGATGSTRITPAPTQTERVIVVVVTATAPATPTTVIAVEPTITPLATLTPLSNLTGTVSANTRTPTVRATSGTNPTAAPRTNTPVRTATSAPPPPSNFIYPALVLLTPGGNDRKRTNEDIPFEWTFPDDRPLALNTGECYLLETTFTSKENNKVTAGSFDSCTWSQPPVFSILPGRARFNLYRPKFDNPNYSGLVTDSTQDYDVRWCLTVIRKTASGVQRLSPTGCLSFPMQGG